jgi:protein-disulfide isomerase
LSLRLAVLVGVLAATAAAAPAPGGKSVRVEHYDPATTPTRGPSNAPVTVELFFAPQIRGGNTNGLPVYRQLEALQQKHPTRIRIVYRVVRRGAQGPMQPTLALEAYAQGKFFEMVTALHTQRVNMTKDQLLDLAAKTGLDPQRANRAIGEDRYGAVLDENERRLERLRGATAPMVFFNDKPLKTSLSAVTDKDLETAYADAYDRALELLDKGIAQKDLLAAFDAQILHDIQPVVVTASPLEDNFDGEIVDHRLASPPLSLTGLPTLGRPDSPRAGGVERSSTEPAPVPIILLCRPNDDKCNAMMRIAPKLNKIYRGEVRLVWAPWFDVLRREDAAELTLLGDAALCAEQVGSSPDDLDASPGWLWVTEMFSQISRSHGRRSTPDKLIDSVAQRLSIDPLSLSACRARMANTTLDWIESARRSGVVGSPAIVIGGRIYEGLNDETAIKALVEAELAPGVLGRCATTGC